MEKDSQITKLSNVVEGNKAVRAGVTNAFVIIYHRNELRQPIVANVIQHDGLRLRMKYMRGHSIKLYQFNLSTVEILLSLI